LLAGGGGLMEIVGNFYRTHPQDDFFTVAAGKGELDLGLN
jgi:hypothetical protein